MPKPSIPIELGGKTRRLRYDFNAICSMEEALGSSISDLLRGLSGSVSFRDLRGMIWAGLLHENAALRQTDVGGWLQELADQGEGGIASVVNKFRDAFEAAWPSTPENSKND